ncbi:heparan-alpha-glucosaminide N-acetyltransferase domain-containing protein [Imtechella halotolerans]|uniref:Heparan-alpha-glucosaminide N-acetyltransferase catalytic domain-containing protein n=1 Tax=Imtechella halotolerans K1 TaxID=946077 RepID=I0WCB1_9FLAO|nr:heparan-alpha-glucosaminide N-acetyltransferase domain-containing protein [Imtechella halotolerans]EID74027.1 hypothetical protein W5A_09365 [Imtechella halotolerans K1]WMQ64578.1 heparan-alpha-glucosaminide N-acetyltransferase domain-containing protein [Imtechella halotolerans]
MKQNTFRLYFIDVMRAFAITMMLQGHFVDSLLAPEFRDESNIIFSTWKYFRGITAPTFFTVAGFIFMYLLIKDTVNVGWNNPRVRKGIKRGLTLIGLGYLLRLNITGLFVGKVYAGFYMVDVLHCIGISILLLISIYLYSYQRKSFVMPSLLLGSTLLLFLFAPIYGASNFEMLPVALANYFTKAYGSVFTIIPWFGYAAFGAFMAVFFNKYKEFKYIYHYAIGITFVLGIALLWFSSPFFLEVYRLTGIELASQIYSNNYLFMRLGNVMIWFTLFMLLRNVITSKAIRTIGQNTLSIYVIHFMLLYGSFSGIGLYKFFKLSLNPYVIVPGALMFVIATVYLSFRYNEYKPMVTEKLELVKQELQIFFLETYQVVYLILQKLKEKIIALLAFVRSGS